MDIIEVVCNGQCFMFLFGDFMLEVGDLFKVCCDVVKVKVFKEWVKIIVDNMLKVGDNFLGEKNISFVELVVIVGFVFFNCILKSLDFCCIYWAILFVICYCNEVLYDYFYSVFLVFGDVILVEVKQYYIINFK